MGKLTKRRSTALGAALALLLITVVSASSAYNNGCRLVSAVAGPKLSLLDVSDLKDSALKRLTLKDVKDRGVLSLGLVDLKDKRLAKVSLYDLRDPYREKLPLSLLRDDALAGLRMSDLRPVPWLNTPPALPIPNNKVASALTSTEQAMPGGALTSLPAAVALLPPDKGPQVKELPLPAGKQLLKQRSQSAVVTQKPLRSAASKKRTPPRRDVASRPPQRSITRHTQTPRRYVAVERSRAFPRTAPRIAVERTAPQNAADYRRVQRRAQREYARVYKREAKAYKRSQKAYEKGFKARMKRLWNTVF